VLTFITILLIISSRHQDLVQKQVSTTYSSGGLGKLSLFSSRTAVDLLEYREIFGRRPAAARAQTHQGATVNWLAVQRASREAAGAVP
jgi:hypothetical protein